jgi:hypothetical protein
LFDALGFLHENGIPYILGPAPNIQAGWAGVRCPFCSDHSTHGGFNLEAGYFNCWKCGWHKTVDFISVTLQIPEEEAYGLYDDYSGRGVLLQRLNAKKVPKAKSIELPGGELNKFHRKYLISRGFDPDFIQSKYHVTGTGPSGNFKLRVIIPIIYHGQVVSYTGRDITGKQPIRYKTLGVEDSVINPKHVLYNLDNCKEEWVCVVEGAFDNWRMGDNFCATLGTTLTDQQIRLLSVYKRVALLFDSESEAQRRAEKYGVQLSSLGVDRVVVLDTERGKDPATYSERLAERVRREVVEILYKDR